MSSLRARSLNDILTFTRATTATYCNASGVLSTAAIDDPRMDYHPTTNEARGLLIEEARTNYLLRSWEFDNAAWTKVQSSITAGAAIAPDGSNTASALVENSAASTLHYILQDYTKAASDEVQAYALSVWARASARSRFRLLAQGTSGAANSAYADFNLSAGTAGSVTTAGQYDNTQARIEAWGGGWYRLSLTFRVNNDAQATVQCVLQLLDNAGNPTYSGDGTSALYIFGAQLEKGMYATSHIFTGAAAVARSTDVCYATPLEPWFSEDEGTLFVEYQVPWTYMSIDAGTYYLVQIDAGSADNRHALYHNAGNPAGYTATAGATQANPTSASDVVANTTTRLAYGWSATANVYAAESSIVFAVTGQSLINDTSNITPANLTTLRVGSYIAGAAPLNGWLRKLRFYPRRLTDNDLRALVA